MRLPIHNYKKWTWPPLTLAFGIPFLGLLIVMLYSGYAPFGESSMFKSDMYHQYFPFFLELRRMLLRGDSILHCWQLGMGIDYLGLYAYYLASPLNFLCLLVPESWMLPLFSLFQPLKIGLAGLSFAYCLKSLFQKNDLSISLFGAFYALCAWALGYIWNIMWLDSFALLPLVVLGTIRLLKDKKFLLYTISLFFSVYTNYYIGLFVCIFVALVFFCYEICRFSGWKRFWADLGRIALFSLIGIGMTAVLTLPAYAALQTTHSSVNEFPETFYLNISDRSLWQEAADAWNVYRSAAESGSATLGQWLEAVGKSIWPTLTTMSTVAGNRNGGLEPTFVNGLPNLYCGVFANVLSFLYLFCRRIRLKEKLCAVFLLVLFNLSFVLPQLDYMWHGFHFTNSIPYRFSFLYSFVLLFMAYRAWMHRKSFRLLHYIAAAALSIGFVFLGADFSQLYKTLTGGGEEAAQALVYPAYNFLLIAAYLLVPGLTFLATRRPYGRTQRKLWHASLQRRRLLGSYLFLGIMAAELILNLLNFNAYLYPGVSTLSYPKENVPTASMLKIIEERETGSDFYRVEMMHPQILNDSALNGYAGISVFTSSANVRTTNFLRSFGLSAKDNWNQYTYKYATPVANLFFNLKYLIERNDVPVYNSYLKNLHRDGNVTLLENEAYLPLGFMTDPTLKDIALLPNGDTDHLTYQEQLLEAATGLNLTLWTKVYGENLAITSDQVELTKANPKTGFCDYTASPAGGTISYTYTANASGLFCIDLHLGKRGNVSVFIKKAGESWEWLYREEYKLTEAFSCAHVEPGDQILVRITCNQNDDSTMLLRSGILNDAAFRQAYDALSRETLDLTHFSNTRVDGTVTTAKGGLLYTSIPQNGNWEVYVDGQKQDVTLIGEAMVGVLLDPGTHNISFRYKNNAFSWGCGISIASLAVLGVLYYLSRRPKYHGKYQKKT